MNTTLELTSPETGLSIPNKPVDVATLDTAKPLVEIFAPYQTTLEKWEAKAKSLIVTDISMKTEMAQARLARLELKEARVAMDKTRKGLVENLKARTSKIDTTARIIREKIEGLEAILLESEEFAERYATKVKAELKTKREAELKPWLDGPDAPFLTDLSNLTEIAFVELVEFYKLARQAKIDAVAKLESDRMAKEASDRAERERIAAENARLKEIAAEIERQAEVQRKQHEAQIAEQKRIAEVEFKRVQAVRAAEKAEADAELKRREDRRKVEIEQERKLRQAAEEEARKERVAIQAAADAEMKKAAALRLAERAKADAAAKKAREETDRLNAELEAKRKAEAECMAIIKAEKAAQEIEARRAAAAPDKAKLVALVRAIRGMDIPSFSNHDLQVGVNIKIEDLAIWIESQADSDLL